ESVSVDVGSTLDLTWQVAADAQGYEVLVHRDLAREDVIFRTATTETTASMSRSDNIVGQPWYWSVRSLGTCGFGEWSSAEEVNVTVTTVHEAAHLGFRIAPHPVTDQSMLVIPEQGAPAQQVTIRTMTGAVVKTDVPESPDLFRGLPDGMYILSVQHGAGGVVVLPFIIQR
ncbi:MAG: T9SS type A sorting domain-containing protein, partial [Candidatus Kapaibacteriota bacterium]